MYKTNPNEENINIEDNFRNIPFIQKSLPSSEEIFKIAFQKEISIITSKIFQNTRIYKYTNIPRVSDFSEYLSDFFR